MRRRHGTPVQQRLSRRHELFIYATASLLLISGGGWLFGHYLLNAPGAFGSAAHPSEAWWMRLHGAAVMAFLVTFGAMLPGHVVQNWQRGYNRASGLSIVIVAAVLAASGYGLYYLVDDRAHAIISVLHWVVGFAAGGLLLLHLTLGKRLAARHRELRMAAGTQHSSLGPIPVKKSIAAQKESALRPD